MMLDSQSLCRFCGVEDTISRICEQRYVRGGAPFACSMCGGAYFQRTNLDARSEEYWDDPVNHQTYTIPEVRATFAEKYSRYLEIVEADNGSTPGVPKQLLEIGCGSGVFLEVASKSGWMVCGLDVSQHAIRLARRFCADAELYCATLATIRFPASSFDLVALWDVIEHVENPEALLQEVRKVLRPGGALVLETSDESCLARKLVRFTHSATAGRVSYLRRIYYPEHRWYFSRRAMVAVLRRAGFGEFQFYYEKTVSEFGNRKALAYGLVRNVSQRLPWIVFETMALIPWLRNKMVVMCRRLS